MQCLDNRISLLWPEFTESKGSVTLLLCGYLQSLARFLELLI